MIHAVFRARAEASPRAVALVLGDRRVTYRQVDEASDAAATALSAAGVTAGDVVPVVLPSSVDLVIALLGVLKCGAAYAALDPGWPPSRQREAARRVAPRTVVVGAPDVFPDGLVLPGAGPRGPVPRPVVDGADAAMVFFTSGTTGPPKAVLSPHRATVRLFDDGSFARFGPDTVLPQAGAVPWDAFTLELWGALLNGGTCVLLEDRPLGPPGLRRVIARHGVNTVFLTTSLFHLIVEEDPDAFTGLRTVLTGGEELRRDSCDRFLARHPGVRLVNGYGPVESTVFALTHDVGTSDAGGPVPLGLPVPRTSVTVMDNGRPCETGETGELCVAGDGLALGYLGDPAETARRFVIAELGGEAVRMYRTGDRGSVGADGLFRFAGRLDRQVKIRGHRIEPAAVERHAERVEGVRRCVVVPLEGAGGGYESMGLVYRAESPGRVTPAEVTAALRARLPAYSVPGTAVEVAAFPLTANGKLDTAALRELLRGAAPAGEVVGDAAVGVVAEAFRDVLGLAGVDRHTSLFALGGTSLSAIRICGRLAEVLRRPVPVSRLLRAESVAGLEEWLAEPVGERACDGDSTDGTDGVRLSGMQGSFLLGNLEPEADLAALCPLVWEIDGKLDTAALARAVADLHQRHAYLAARYDLAAGGVARPGGRAAEFHDIDGSGADGTADARRLLYEVLARPLSLADGEVWRTVRVRTAPGRSLLGVVVHHIAFDGWSAHVLARDLGTAYAARAAGRAPVFPAAVPGLAGTARGARELRAAADLAGQAEFWRRELAGVPALSWPVERTGGAVVRETVLNRDNLSVPGGTGHLAALLDAVGSAVAEVTGQDDFAVGVPVNRRGGGRADDVVACLIDTVPVRRRPGVPAADAAAQALRHGDLPFTEMARMVPRLPGGRNPVYQVMAIVQDTPEPCLSLPGCAARPDRSADLERPLADLVVELFVGAGGRPRLRIMRDPDRVGHPTMAAVFACVAARFGSRADPAGQGFPRLPRRHGAG